MDDQESITEQLAGNIGEISEDNEVPLTNEKVTSSVDPKQTNNAPPVDFTSWGWLLVIWSVFYVTHGYPPFGKPPEQERLRPSYVSPQNLLTDTQVLNGQATENYWKVAVADLHRSRFSNLFIEDQNEQAGIYFDRILVDMKFRLQDAQYATNPPVVAFVAGIDGDLMEMSKRHLDYDLEYMKILGELLELYKTIGVPKDTESIGLRKEQGVDFMLRAIDDPSFLDQISDDKVRSLLQRAVELEDLKLGQYREIEIMQARMQERFKENNFPLPIPLDEL